MRRTLAIDCGDGVVDVDVEVAGTEASVGDLLEAAGCPRTEVVWHGGRPVGTTTALTVLAPPNGSTLELGSPCGGSPMPTAVQLQVIAGLDAGSRHDLDAGQHRVGRAAGSTLVLHDRTVSRAHAVVAVDPNREVLVADVGSSGGTFVGSRPVGSGTPVKADDVVGLGATKVVVRRPLEPEPLLLGPLEADGRRAVRRPPHSSARPPEPLDPPPDDGVDEERPRFSWAAALVPVASGVVLARFVDPKLALFSLLGPLVLIGQWVEDRRRHGSSRRRSRADDARRIAAWANEIDAAEHAEVERRRSATPDPAVLGEVVEHRTTQLWRRRSGQPGDGLVSVGLGSGLRWSVPLTRPAEGAAAVLVDRSRLDDVPLQVDLGPGRHVGLAGPRAAAVAVARWIVTQLATHHGPADVHIAVITDPDHANDWAWTALLPHCAASGAGGSRLVATGVAGVARLQDLFRSLTAGRLVIVRDAAENAAALNVTGAATLVLAPSRRALPSTCEVVVELLGSDGIVRVTESTDGQREDGLAIGITDERARLLARSLAGLTDPDASDDVPLPEHVRLRDLLGFGDEHVMSILDRWALVPSVRAVIGVAAHGREAVPFTVDLDADGPHALVAGTTGAGKSELLRTLVASLAATSPPDRLSFVLIDYKGGAAFGECSRLPHVVGLVTDLDGVAAGRALAGLDAEVRRREQVLLAVGVRDIVDHPQHVNPSPAGAADPFPRLVIVVDELAALVAELPDLVHGLVSIASRGRSLGIHLVLGTQRPAGVVNGAIRTNCTLRVCLRVPDEAEAIDVVGSPEAARFDRRSPGRAHVRRGAGDITEIKVALASGAPVNDAGDRLVVRPLCVDPDPWPPCAPAPASTDLDALVDACRNAAERRGGGRGRRPWLDPLPETLHLADLRSATTPAGSEVALGLLDLPDEQRMSPLRWDMAAGALLAYGSCGSAAVALTTAAMIASTTFAPDDLHIHCLDFGGSSMASVVGLAHVGSVVRHGEQERVHRLLRWLHTELHARQQGSDGPRILLLVNGAGSMRAVLDGLDGVVALDLVERIIVDGPAVGIVSAVAAERPAEVPAAWTAASARRLAFRLSDPTDLLTLGAPRLAQARWPSGRCLDVETGLVAQLVTEGWFPRPAESPRARPAVRVGRLGDDVDLESMRHRARVQGGTLTIPLGRSAEDLDVVEVALGSTRGLLVVGGRGAGKTTVLDAMARAAAHAGCRVVVAATDRDATGRPSQPDVVIVDDAETWSRPPRTGAIVVAATTHEHLRRDPQHWTAALRTTAAVVVLRPRRDQDGDPVGLPLLPRSIVPLDVPGRGVLVDGGAPVVLQLARSRVGR